MRQDQWLNTVVIDGRPMGVWDTLAGGDMTASETKYRKGGMMPEQSLAGPSSVGNLTLGRLLERVDWEYLRTLMATNRVGKAPCSVSRTPLDLDANPIGKPLTYTGLLLTANPGDNDSNSEAAQVWQIVVSTHGSVS